MSATDELRRLLDERGTEHYDYRAEVWWGGESSGGGGAKYTAYEQTDGLICVEIADLTPEQAIAATLGRSNVVRYVGLRQGEYWERTENGDYYCGGCGWKVTDHDSYCPECGGALHNATLGSFNCTNGCTNSERTETCHDKNGFDSMFGFECTVCGAMTDGYMLATEDMGHYKQFNFCPNCGRKVVGE